MDYLEPDMVYGLNLYAYCMNDPINYSDPSGHVVISSFILAIAIGATAGFLSKYIPDVIANIKTDGFQASDLLTINKDNMNDYLGSVVAGAIGGLSGGLGLNLLGTMAFAGIGQVIGDSISGDITSFCDAVTTFFKSAIMAGLTYGITSAVSTGFGKIQLKNKILNNYKNNTLTNSKIKNLTGSYGKTLKGMKVGRNSTEQFLKQLSFTNSNMAITETAGGVISIICALGGF